MKIELGEKARGPLAGIRVLDFSAVISGPLCTQILGDLGADVIKVESPHGDTARMMGPPFKAGFTPLFTHANRNKRGIVLDMKADGAGELARKLAAGVDVVVENFRPGVADRLGIGYEQLSKEHPSLVYVSISGFGATGPYKDHPAYDLVIQALSGLGEQQGTADEPKLVQSIVADKVSSLTAAYATMAALFARERNGGLGQKVEVPMLDAFSAFLMPDVLGSKTFLPEEDGPPFMTGSIYRAWKTSDGHVAMLLIEDRQFFAFCKAIRREDLIEDERTSNLFVRVANAEELFRIIEPEIEKFTTAEIVARAREFGAPLAPVNSIQEFLDDEQVQHSEIIQEFERPDVGTARLISSPVRFEKTPTNMRHFAPSIGEHRDEILEELGLSAEEITALREAGVLG